MSRSLRVAFAIAALVLGAVYERNALAQSMVAFVPKHVVRPTSASLSPSLTAKIDAQKNAATISTAEDLIAFGLTITSNAMHFGLSHHTRLSFDETEREGNCVEYAELFAAVVNRERGSIDAHAWVIRSDARILGKAPHDPAWKDHDWVLLVIRSGASTRRFYVDPTLFDMGFDWNIANAVHGEVAVHE